MFIMFEIDPHYNLQKIQNYYEITKDLVTATQISV